MSNTGKRILFALIFVFLVVAGAMLGIRFLAMGAINVTLTGASANIKAAEIDSKGNIQKDVILAQDTEETSSRLRPGRYLITAYTKSYAASQFIEIEARSSVDVELEIKQLKSPVPIYGQSAYDMVADGSTITFIDAETQLLSQINAAQARTLNTTIPLTSAEWADASLGLGLGTNNSLYQINAGSFSPVSLPFAVNKNPSFRYDIVSDGTIYLSDGQSVYSGKSGNFKKIYSVDGNTFISDIEASVNGVAILEKVKEKVSALSVVSTSGKVSKADLPVTTVEWSPSGNNIAVGVDGKGLLIMDKALTNESYVAYSPNIVSAVWSGKDVFYSSGISLVRYSPQAQRSYTAANFNSGTPPSELTGDKTGEGIFASIKSGEKGGIYKISTNNTKFPDFVYQLDVYFPEALLSCRANYLNLVSPVILLYPFDNSNQCKTDVRALLFQYGINPKDVSFYTYAPPAEAE